MDSSGSAPPTPNLALIEAPFLIGVMVSCVLFGITCAQTVHYYRTYPEDEIIIKGLVLVLFLLETAHQMLVGEAIHFLFVVSKLPEKSSGLLFVRSTFAVSFFLTVVITTLVQGFYAWRVRSISKLHGWSTTIVALIGLSSFFQFGLGIATGVRLFTSPSLPSVHFPIQQGLYSAQLALAMFCDIAITLALVYYLNLARSGFGSTEGIIDSLILFSVNIGLVTSAISVCTFATYNALPSSTMFALFLEIISKIYVNSLLVTLNSRTKIRNIDTGATEHIEFEQKQSNATSHDPSSTSSEHEPVPVS